MYYWVTMLTNSYAVYLGVSCVAKEQAQGTAEYLFTKPVGRNKVVCAKAVACVCNLLALAVFSGLCNYFTAILPLGGLEQRKAAFTTTLGLFLTGLTLFAITLLASSLTRTYKGAVRIGAGILLLFYGISITAEYLEAPMLYCLTPLKFFDVYTVAISGIQFSFFLLAMIIAIGSVITAQRVWTLREI
jgi:ABC-2 type transport system permease protein